MIFNGVRWLKKILFFSCPLKVGSPKERNFAYADKLVDTFLSAENKYSYFIRAYFGNKNSLIKMTRVRPDSILGQNNNYCLTLPKGSHVTIKFTDNQVVDYPNQDDLFVKEHGGVNGKVIVYVSHDGKKFDSLGITYDS